MRNAFLVLAFSVVASACSYGQSAMPTAGALSRTFMIKVNGEQGTMFAVHVDGRQYWVTARHLLTGAKAGPPWGKITAKTSKLEVLLPDSADIQWKPYEFDVIDPGDENADVVVLAPRLPMPGFSTKSLSMMDSNESVFLGGECSFLGFPFAESYVMKSNASAAFFRLPYMKHCYISAILSGPPAMYVLDGINNFGFSGGPVLYNTGPQQRVIAVISGFRPELSEVQTVEVLVPETAPTSTQSGQSASPKMKPEKHQVVILNPGIIHAYSIDVALMAIRKNPIGRPETESDSVPTKPIN